ncbi:2-amino-4-hydroxy-6-hydroxymethyldihydropteridine diphosphokinase [Salimicrobium halophilum]|uniref:2-amino-4-hydroxy-6-hydroxymethyldihydropteridine diphosphokinase n=1 Tax=Salimicrobium halophilum TaxID=86666 RepID=A0A1G8W404_9BACI|nr:2-amino-4-hydroxy-6-hydroxymethyldihydropteridine diphosphokinase [Salimicrobium halophilum]SDJ72836.1 2-amino-4-hydroxy-6-hydroxymethyldihydropteridinediphosphokinase [Salimicrobium halophilum]
MQRAYIALGSNISPRKRYLQEAIRLLEENPAISVDGQSFIYETDPVGYVEQDDFLNMVIAVDTSFSPLALLDACQEVEDSLGRVRSIRWGPRTIDLDILIFEGAEMNTERLVLPHPYLYERAFVLVPLADVNRDLCVPPEGRTVDSLVEDLSKEEVAAVRRYL